MRVNIEVSDLSDFQWDRLQEELRVEYDIRPGATRACVVFRHGELERHVEMALSTYVALNSALELFAVAEAMAPPEGLAPDAKLVRATESAFPGAGPVRTYSDGSQSYGPYAPPAGG